DGLKGDGAIGFGILREIDVGHAAAAELAEDLILAELTAGGGDHFLLPPWTGGFISIRKLCSRSASSGISGGSSRLLFSNGLPTISGLAPSRAAMAGPLIRWNVLCEIKGEDGPAMRMPSAVQSWMALPRNIGLAAPRISMPTLAPSISTPSI